MTPMFLSSARYKNTYYTICYREAQGNVYKSCKYLVLITMAKIIVLCVDRDDDLGQKTKIRGPIIGKERNIEAAKQLVIADPSESDANAIFEGVRIFEELGKDAAGIVTLTGHKSRGYKADRIILVQLDEVLSKFKGADGIYLVTDGADDDEIIPIIQSRIKIVSKKTLIVKQASELERSYYVIKQVLRDPHFARIIFGLPGVILLTVAFLQELGARLIVLTIGVYLVIKGFGMEDPIINAFRNFRETTSIERASFPIYVGSLLTFVLSLWAGFEQVTAVQEFNVIKIGAGFASGFISLFTVSAILFFVGRIGDMSYRKEVQQIRRYMLSIVTVLAFWFVILRATDLVSGAIFLDEFLAWVFITFILTVLGISLVKRLYMRKFIVPKLKHGLEVFDVHGRKLGEIQNVNKKSGYLTVSNDRKIPFTKIVLVTDYVAVNV